MFDSVLPRQSVQTLGIGGFLSLSHLILFISFHAHRSARPYGPSHLLLPLSSPYPSPQPPPYPPLFLTPTMPLLSRLSSRGVYLHSRSCTVEPGVFLNTAAASPPFVALENNAQLFAFWYTIDAQLLSGVNSQRVEVNCLSHMHEADSCDQHLCPKSTRVIMM